VRAYERERDRERERERQGAGERETGSGRERDRERGRVCVCASSLALARVRAGVFARVFANVHTRGHVGDQRAESDSSEASSGTFYIPLNLRRV